MPVQGCTLLYLSACTRVHFTLSQCLYNGALYLFFFYHLKTDSQFPIQRPLLKGYVCNVPAYEKLKLSLSAPWNLGRIEIYLPSFLLYNQQDAPVSQIIYSCKTLYMFRTIYPSIIRSSKLHICLLPYVQF